MGTDIAIDSSGMSAASAAYPQAPMYSGQIGSMSDAQMDKVASDFESMFISEMLQPMFGDTEGSDAFGSTESNDVYKSLLMDEYGKQITRSGGIGVADFVKKELLKLQESANPARTRNAAKKNAAQLYGSQNG